MPTKRCVLNLNFTSTREYHLIDWAKLTRNIPAADQFAGPYVFKWTGEGTLRCFNDGNWEVDDDLSTSYTQSDTDRWTATDPRIVLSRTPGAAAIANMNIQFIAGTASNDSLIFYRLEDEEDYLAGRMYRRDYLQQIIDLNPGCLRFMNWFGGNNSYLMRWEDRSLPTDPFWGAFGTSGQITTYGTTSGTNQYTLAGLPTLTHGLAVQCTIGTGMVRGGSKTVTAITKANPGVVTSAAHGFSNGDIVVFQISAGMTELNYRQCTVANKTDDTFELSGLDTSGFGVFSAGTVKQYISLNDWPVVFPDATTPASHFSNAYIATNDIKAFYFDKTLIASRDGSGNLQTGAWIFNDIGATNYHRAGVPLEICVQFMRELNELASAQGKGPIHMWVNIPQRGLLSMDDDYDSDSNAALGTVDVCLNGAGGYEGLPSDLYLLVELSNETWNTAGSGFSQALYSQRREALRWGGVGNSGTFHALRSCVMCEDIRAAFPSDMDRIKLVMAGQGTAGTGGTNAHRINGNATLDADALFISLGGGDPIDYHDYFAWAAYFEPTSAYHTANAANLAADYVAATTDEEREEICAEYITGIHGQKDVTITIASPGVVTYPLHGKSANQQVRIFTTGALPTGLTADTNYFVKTILDENTFTLSATSGGAVINTSGSQSGTHTMKNWTGEQICRYRDSLLSTYSTEMTSHGKETIMYEGGKNWQVTGNASADIDTLLVAVAQSNTWAHRQFEFLRAFNGVSNAWLPSVYVMVDARWGYATPDTYSGGVEGAALDEAWERISLYNNGRFRLGLRLAS